MCSAFESDLFEWKHIFVSARDTKHLLLIISPNNVFALPFIWTLHTIVFMSVGLKFWNSENKLKWVYVQVPNKERRINF